MAGNKQHYTFSFEPHIKKEFQVECAFNGIDMSTVLQNFMESYIKFSKRSRNEKTR